MPGPGRRRVAAAENLHGQLARVASSNELHIAPTLLRERKRFEEFHVAQLHGLRLEHLRSRLHCERQIRRARQYRDAEYTVIERELRGRSRSYRAREDRAVECR